MSATTSGRRAPRFTARVSTIISSIVAGTVESWPRTVIAAESPTRITSAPAASASRPDGASYAVTIAIGCRRAFSSTSSVSASFPGAGVPGAGLRGLVVMVPPRSGRRCRSGGWSRRGPRRRGRVGRSRRPRRSPRRGRSAGRGRRCGLSSRARGGGRARPRARRGEAAVPRREREPVGVAHRRDDSHRQLEVEVANHAADDRGLLRVLLAEVGAIGTDEVEELEADRGDGAKVAGAVRAFEPLRELRHLDPRLEARADRARPRTGRRRRRRRPPRPSPDRPPRRADRRRGRRVSPNWVGVHEQAHDHRLALLPRRAEQGEMARRWNAPIVGTRPIDPLAQRTECLPELGDRAHRLHASAFVVSASATYIGSSSGRSRRIAAMCSADGRPSRRARSARSARSRSRSCAASAGRAPRAARRRPRAASPRRGAG